MSEQRLPDEKWRSLFDRAGIEFGYRPLAAKAGIEYTRARRVLIGLGTTDAAVSAVASAFGVTPDAVRKVRGESGSVVPFTLPDDAGRLNDKERDVIRAMVRALLDAKDNRHAEQPATDTADPTPAARASGTEGEKTEDDPQFAQYVAAKVAVHNAVEILDHLFRDGREENYDVLAILARLPVDVLIWLQRLIELPTEHDEVVEENAAQFAGLAHTLGEWLPAHLTTNVPPQIIAGLRDAAEWLRHTAAAAKARRDGWDDVDPELVNFLRNATATVHLAPTVGKTFTVQPSAARAQGTQDQKTSSHATDVDTGTDPEGQAADAARPNVWRDKPTDLSEHRSRREAGSAPSYAEQLGLVDILSKYNIGESEKQAKPFKALWNAGYRYEHRDILRAAFNAASNISGTKSGSLRPGKSGTKFWEAFAEQLGGTYTYKGFDLPEAEPIAQAARHLDPRFAPDDPTGFYGTNDIGEENQDSNWPEDGA